MGSYYDRKDAARKVADAVTEMESAKHAVGSDSDRYRKAEQSYRSSLADATMAGATDSDLSRAMGR